MSRGYILLSRSATPDLVARSPVQLLSMKQPQAAVRSLHILVAEDNPVNLRLLVSILRRYGHRITTVENGEAAVAVVEEQGPFDIILMDSSMPVMDGIEATRRIRASASPDVAKIPIVAVTALAMTGDRERHLAAGMNEYVSKPVTPRRLFAAIGKVIEN